MRAREREPEEKGTTNSTPKTKVLEISEGNCGVYNSPQKTSEKSYLKNWFEKIASKSFCSYCELQTGNIIAMVQETSYASDET